MSLKSILFCLLALLCVQLLITYQAFSTEDQNQPKIGETAPLFRLASLNEDSVSLANLRGKFVVIHFAASW